MTDRFMPLCPGQEETIYLFLDGELPPARRDAFAAHLPGCPACQTLLAEIETLYVDLANLEPVQPDSWAIAAIIARLPQPETAPPFSLAGYLVLAMQMLAGIGLLLLALPRLLAPYQAAFATVARSNLDLIFQDVAGWGQNSVQAVEGWFAGQWSQLATLAAFNISPPTAFSLLLVAGLIWLLGNGLLLNRHFGSFKNGRSS